jgi:tRNA 2-thiouridine synthesizing protein E
MLPSEIATGPVIAHERQRLGTRGRTPVSDRVGRGEERDIMSTVTFNGKTFEVDQGGFLVDPQKWDEDFARAMAPEARIPDGLTAEHWNVIRFIRQCFATDGRCPLVYQTCRTNDLRLDGLRRLFPTGYLRGACKLAGLTFRDGSLESSWLNAAQQPREPEAERRTYRIDVRGFLIEPSEWDEDYAMHRAHDMKLPEGLTDGHWKVIRFLRERFGQTAAVPTVYEACEALALELDQLERLFPDGYHRGAVKLSGLRVP